MTKPTFMKESLEKWVAYFTLTCVLMTSQQPFKLNAQECPPPYTISEDSSCVVIDQEDAQRARTAKIVVGATLVALVGGIACLTCSSSKHRSHSSSSYYSHDSYYSPSYSNNHHHHHHHHHHSYSDDSSFLSDSSDFDYHSKSDPQFFEREADGNLPARMRQLPRIKNAKESDQIAGQFTTHPSFSASGKGSVSAFVQLPDGTTQLLGSLPFSASGGSSLSYGPFTQKGSYIFGIKIDEGTTLSSHTKVCSIEVNLNGSTVESRDFFAPGHVSSHYEPSPCEYTIR